MVYYSIFLLLSCTSSYVYSLAEELAKGDRTGQELLLCRKCGSDVADSYYLFTMESPGAWKVEKQNLFGRQNITVQTLVNPFGINFDIITAEKARCDNLGMPQGADSWFPGYTWRICSCPRCGQHLGWTYESALHKGDEKPKGHVQLFYGIILSNVLGENYENTKLAALKPTEVQRDRFPNNDAQDILNLSLNENHI